MRLISGDVVFTAADDDDDAIRAKFTKSNLSNCSVLTDKHG